MQRKISIMALGVLSSLLMLSGSPTYAESGEETSKTKDSKEQPTEKKDEPKEIIVTVKLGDTLDAIAKAHNTTYARLFDANKDIINPDMIDIGDKIRIPKADEKLPERFNEYQASRVVVAPQVYSYNYAPQARTTAAQTYAPRGSSAGNTYYSGQCTWWAKNKRPDLPNMLGNGGQWTANAAAQGYATGTTPKAGAVAEIPGHVMYVESVNSNGTINISEMNYNGGTGVVNHRTISSSGVNYIY